MLNTIEKRLLESYQKIYDENGQPEGMFNVRPGIPFVGNNYLDKKTPNVLSYASAENLSYAYQSHLGTLQPKKVLLHRYKEKNYQHISQTHYDAYITTTTLV